MLYRAGQCEEALKRLIERRYIVEASPTSDGVVAGLWASLGLPPGIAEQNLAKCGVRVESINVDGAPEFAKALGEFGAMLKRPRAPNSALSRPRTLLSPTPPPPDPDAPKPRPVSLTATTARPSSA